MKYFYLYILLPLIFLSPTVFSQEASGVADTTEVRQLTEEAYRARLTDPEQTLTYGKKALELAKKLNYQNGIGEAYRMIGIGYYYQYKNEEAVSAYLNSLKYFISTKNREGQAKVYNNIGNLYRNVDYDKSLVYFRKALAIAEELNIKDLIAGCNLNLGIIDFRKKNYHQALQNFEKANELFSELNNAVGLTQSLQNEGVIYYNLNQLAKAEKLLTLANQKAKENDLNTSIASINLTLTSVFVAQKKFKKAEEVLTEGLAFAKQVKNPKLEQDYSYVSFELEYRRGNYEKALHYLRQVYTRDSIEFNNSLSLKINLLQEQYRQREKERKNELIIERQKNDRILFWASTVVAVMFLFVIGLLYVSNRRKIRTNKQLTILNSEISQQKEELDWINHRLEEIIDERTKDLQIKNKKLSDYSWHLSHQIRGPIATMKGLMLLEKDNLIDEKEFISEMEKCLNEIDLKIMNINEALHNPKQIGFSSSRKD